MIPDKLYNQIIKSIPIVCVDAFIVSENKILLLKRNNEPAKNEWWVPGGRVLLNETLIDGILRKVKDETNLTIDVVSELGFTETIFENKHTINICFLAKSLDSTIVLNEEHSDWKWFDIDNLPTEIDDRLRKKILEIDV
jgi:colanic acid biosynthesis protein WcaH